MLPFLQPFFCDRSIWLKSDYKMSAQKNFWPRISTRRLKISAGFPVPTRVGKADRFSPYPPLSFTPGRAGASGGQGGVAAWAGGERGISPGARRRFLCVGCGGIGCAVVALLLILLIASCLHRSMSVLDGGHPTLPRSQHEGAVRALVSDQGGSHCGPLSANASVRVFRRPSAILPGVSGDSITTNDVAYPRSTCAMGRRDGHGWVYVDARNDVEAG